MLISSANAKEYAAKSAERRKKRPFKYPPIVPAEAESGALTDRPAFDERADHAQRLKAHLDRIDEMLANCSTAADWRDLSNARLRFFQQWARLKGIPTNPRPRAAKSERAPATDPLPSEPG